MRRPALGAQARAALALVEAPSPWLGPGHGDPRPGPPDGADTSPDLPLGVPAIAAAGQAAAVEDARREADRTELVELRARVVDLEADLAAAQRDTDRRVADAVAVVERRHNDRQAKTMRGRVPSILTGGEA